MRNYIILLLVVMILALSSYVYKIHNENIFEKFPHHVIDNESESSLFLFLFFSVKNCRPCLEIVKVLNRLAKKYKVIGVIPEGEFTKEDNLEFIREKLGAEFEIIKMNKFKKYIPQYAPTLMAVSKSKEIMFVLPAVPNEREYFERFIESFYNRAWPLLEKHKY